MKYLFCFLVGLAFVSFSFAQSSAFQLKKDVSAEEVEQLILIMEKIDETDQKYRGYLSVGTLDDNILAQIDSVYDASGMEAALKFRQSLNLSLTPEVKDSLWQLQHNIDLQNHLTLRGIFHQYGYLPEELLKDKYYVQLLLLMHPPKNWNIPTYLKIYSDMLLAEVHAGRMKPKTFASFYDNIKGKILREPQLYGTNERFDSATQKILPPLIQDLKASNEARVAIGLPPLKEGEYMLIDEK